MYVYEIEYKDGYTRLTEYMYIVSSTDYDANDYIRDYDEFQKMKKDGQI